MEKGSGGRLAVTGGVTPAQYEKNFTFVRRCHSQNIDGRQRERKRWEVGSGVEARASEANHTNTNTHSAKRKK